MTILFCGLHHYYGRSCIDGVTSVALRCRTDDKEREQSRNCELPDGAVGEWRSTLFSYGLNINNDKDSCFSLKKEIERGEMKNDTF